MKRLLGSRQALIAVARALAVSFIADSPSQPVSASTIGNTDVLEANDSITTAWLPGIRVVTQRYGCTTTNVEDYVPSCALGYNYWHQGIDMDTGGGSLQVFSAVEGTVAQVKQSCLAYGCDLGYLAIRTLGGNIIYLLHGSANCSPAPGFCVVGNTIHVGDAIYSTGSNGPLCLPGPCYHLHFEVHASALNQLLQHPGNDINPEGWLWGTHPYGQELASWVGANPDIQAAPELDQFYFNPNDDTQLAHLRVTRSSGLLSAGLAWRDVSMSVSAYSNPVVVSVAPQFYDAFTTMSRTNGVKWIQFHNSNPDFASAILPPPPGTTLVFGGISAVTTGYQPVAPLDRYAWIHLLAIDLNGFPYYKSAQVDLTTTPATYTWNSWSACGSGSIACPDAGVTFAGESKTAAFAHNNVAVVARGNDNSVYYTALNHGTWDPSWIKLGEPASYGKFPGGLALNQYEGNWSSAGAIDVFALSNYYGSANMRIFHIRCGGIGSQGLCNQYWDIPQGQDRFAYSAVPTADFTVTAFSALRVDLFVHDSRGNLEHTFWDPHYFPSNTPPNWPSDWEYFGSPPTGLASELAALSWGRYDQEVTALAVNGHRYQMRYGDPQSNPCYVGSPPICWNGWYQIAGT